MANYAERELRAEAADRSDGAASEGGATSYAVSASVWVRIARHHRGPHALARSLLLR